MDAELKLLAGASLDVSAAEEALSEGATLLARERLDSAAAILADLRASWPAMGAGARAVVGPAAREVRDRMDAVSARVPRLSALSVGAAVVDPEQELEPDA